VEVGHLRRVRMAMNGADFGMVVDANALWLLSSGCILRLVHLTLTVTFPIHAPPARPTLTYLDDRDSFQLWKNSMLFVLRETPRLSAPHVDGWRWEHVRDLNVPAWSKWAKRYSLVSTPDAAADFQASGTRWALHEETGVDRDATRLQGEYPKLRPLAASSVMSRLAHYYAVARIADVATDYMGPVQRYVFNKASVERVIHTTRIGLRTTFYFSLLSFDLENVFKTISRRSFLVELYKIMTCILISRWMR
jgi:hypothetical protein